jgi:PadR family transcriptional regulator PadR
VVLLTIAVLMEEAYSVAICDEIERVTERKVKLSVVHAVLNRMDTKGFVKSHLGDPTNARGGRRKRFFTITHAGKVALTKVKDQRDQFWSVIPEFNLNFI